MTAIKWALEWVPKGYLILFCFYAGWKIEKLEKKIETIAWWQNEVLVPASQVNRDRLDKLERGSQVALPKSGEGFSSDQECVKWFMTTLPDFADGHSAYALKFCEGMVNKK